MWGRGRCSPPEPGGSGPPHSPSLHASPGSPRAPPPCPAHVPRGYLAIVPAEWQVAGRRTPDAQSRRSVIAIAWRADSRARGLAHIAGGVLAAAGARQAHGVGSASAAWCARGAAAAHAVGVEVYGLVLVGALHGGEHAAVLLARGLRRAAWTRQVHWQVVLRVPRSPPLRHPLLRRSALATAGSALSASVRARGGPNATAVGQRGREEGPGRGPRGAGPGRGGAEPTVTKASATASYKGPRRRGRRPGRGGW